MFLLLLCSVFFSVKSGKLGDKSDALAGNKVTPQEAIIQQMAAIHQKVLLIHCVEIT